TVEVERGAAVPAEREAGARGVELGVAKVGALDKVVHDAAGAERADFEWDAGRAFEQAELDVGRIVAGRHEERLLDDDIRRGPEAPGRIGRWGKRFERLVAGGVDDGRIIVRRQLDPLLADNGRGFELGEQDPAVERRLD